MELTCVLVCLLDGNKYTTQCREAGNETPEILSDCELPYNKAGGPLLVAGSMETAAPAPMITLKFSSGSSAVTLR
jgi:hypothetical protein